MSTWARCSKTSPSNAPFCLSPTASGQRHPFNLSSFMKALRLALFLVAGLLSSTALPAATTTGAKKPVTANKPGSGQINNDAIVDFGKEAPQSVVDVTKRDDDDELTMAHGGDEPMTKKE